MLEKLDLDLIFHLVREAGFSSCRFYAERTLTTEFEIEDKDNKSRHHESGGLSIELKKEGNQTLFTFRTNQFSTQSVLNLLGLPQGETLDKNIPAPTIASSLTMGKKLQNLQLLIRRINLENSLTKPISFWFREKKQKYQWAQSPGEIKSGETELGEARFQIESSYKGKPLNFSHHLSSGSLDDLWTQLQSLLSQIQKRIKLGSSEQWPLPEGPLPVGWSSQSLAKLADCFLRGFEGDLVLKDFSYLNSLSLPLDYHFSIQEKEPPLSQDIDHEGSSRKSILIFDGQKPKGLATDKKVASEFSISSTGHSRRESFERPSTISFWHPVMRGNREVDSVLSLMSEGIWVEELDIQDLDLITGTVTLYFSQLNLVHQGAIGESVQPFSWTVSLLELLASLTHFSQDKSTTGLFHTKQKQRILTEYTTPSALSLSINLPGSVPKNHYW
jgi:predicted Zn-dependent protease